MSRSARATDCLIVDYCGEQWSVPMGGQLVVGREADVIIDENPYLHRRFLVVGGTDGLWWMANVGSQLTATVSDPDGYLQAWLAPDGKLPLAVAHIIVRFTAGSTTYELEIHTPHPPFGRTDFPAAEAGTTTARPVTMTADQRLLIVALAENVLRGDSRSGAAVPSSAAAARRLGWNLTKFNRKLDNVCEKLAKTGVQGLHGSPGALASNRRGRLVEFAVATRLIRPEDLALLPEAQAGRKH